MIRRRFVPCVVLLLTLTLAAPALAQDQEEVPPEGLTGDWSLAMEGPQGLVNIALKLVQKGKEITGTLDGPMGSLEIAGEIEEADVTFWASVDTPDGVFDLVFAGTLEENKKIAGWMDAGEFSAEFTATRVEKS